MPHNKLQAFDKVDCLDTNAVKQRYWIASVNVEEHSNYTADIGTDFYNTVHPCDHPKTFYGSLEELAMGVNEVEFPFIFCNLLRLMMRLNLGNVVLTNEAQDGNQASFELQGIKWSTLKVGRNE